MNTPAVTAKCAAAGASRGHEAASPTQDKRVYAPGAKTLGDRRLRLRGAEGLGASAVDGGRLGTESSVPAFSRPFAGTKGGIRERPGSSGQHQRGEGGHGMRHGRVPGGCRTGRAGPTGCATPFPCRPRLDRTPSSRAIPGPSAAPRLDCGQTGAPMPLLSGSR